MVNGSIDREQLFRELGDIKVNQHDGFQGINDRLDTLNSRTRKLETKVAIMWFLWVATGTVVMALITHIK